MTHPRPKMKKTTCQRRRRVWTFFLTTADMSWYVFMSGTLFLSGLSTSTVHGKTWFSIENNVFVVLLYSRRSILNCVRLLTNYIFTFNFIKGNVRRSSLNLSYIMFLIWKIIAIYLPQKSTDIPYKIKCNIIQDCANRCECFHGGLAFPLTDF